MDEKQIRNIVRSAVRSAIINLNETKTIKKYKNNGHTLCISEYDMGDEEDRSFIISNKYTIWDILQTAYENNGGFKGFRSINDMLKKSPFYKIGFIDSNIVTVSVYNGYLGGSKCVGVACVKDSRHQDSVKLLKLIIENNITDWDRWIWIEASGKVEEMCKEAGAFNVPSEYAGLYLEYRPFSPIDGDKYHYKRMIRGELETKTIFGFKDRESYEIIKGRLNDQVTDFLNKHNLHINESKDSVRGEYMSRKHPAFQYKAVIDYFVYLKDDALCNEFTEEMIEILKRAILGTEQYLDDESLTEKERYYLKLAIEEGNRVLSSVTRLSPLSIKLSS